MLACFFPHLLYAMPPFHLSPAPSFSIFVTGSPSSVSIPSPFPLSIYTGSPLIVSRYCILVSCLPLSLYHLYRFLYPSLVPHSSSYVHVIHPRTLIAYCLLTSSTPPLRYLSHPTESRSFPPQSPIIHSNLLALSLRCHHQHHDHTPFLYKSALLFSFSSPVI